MGEPLGAGTLTRPTLAGRIEFDGELIGRIPGEPLIEERKWLRLRAMINGRRRGRPSTNRYLGSEIIRCGRCGKPMGADQSFMGEGKPVRRSWSRSEDDPAGACMPVPSGLEVGHVRLLQGSVLWQLRE